MLTGSELLAKVRELGQAPRDQIAIACGYVSKAGKPAFTAFFEALNAAHGLTLPPVAAKPKRGKPLSWNVAVSKTGVIPVSAGYSALLGLAAEDRVTIEHQGDALILRKAPSEPATVVVTAAPEVATTSESEEVAELTITAPTPEPVRELAPF